MWESIRHSMARESPKLSSSSIAAAMHKRQDGGDNDPGKTLLTFLQDPYNNQVRTGTRCAGRGREKNMTCIDTDSF